jgi:hypothetical protein
MAGTDVTDLSCMTGDNVAAIALQMQKTALEAEARILLLEQKLRYAVNAPTIIQTSTANITGLVFNLVGEQSVGPFGGGTFTTNFNNTNSNRNIDESSRSLIGELGEGEYEIGVYVSLSPSGTVDDNTFRAITIAVDRLDPTVISTITPSERRVCESVYTAFEANAAIPVDMCVTLRFRLTALDRIKFLCTHGNTSSSLTALAGTIVWLTKISTADSVVVV